jgi:hypothetical protein
MAREIRSANGRPDDQNLLVGLQTMASSTTARR